MDKSNIDSYNYAMEFDIDVLKMLKIENLDKKVLGSKKCIFGYKNNYDNSRYYWTNDWKLEFNFGIYTLSILEFEDIPDKKIEYVINKIPYKNDKLCFDASSYGDDETDIKDYESLYQVVEDRYENNMYLLKNKYYLNKKQKDLYDEILNIPANQILGYWARKREEKRKDIVVNRNSKLLNVVEGLPRAGLFEVYSQLGNKFSVLVYKK
jgi:hypothetical protein